MTKVLHIHSGNLYGGVETFLATLGRWRDLAPSMEMSAALCFDARIAALLRAEGVPTSILGPVRLRRPGSVWRARHALAELLDRDRFDVAVCHQAWPHAIFGPVAKTAGVPLVSWIHMRQSGRHWIERLAWRVEPDLIVCNSKFTASMVPPTSARVEVVYPPITGASGARGASGASNAPGARNAIRNELSTPVDDVVIIQVSRMETIKGQIVCLEAVAQLRDRPGWTCWQVGGAQRALEQRYLDSLRAAAEHLGISNRIRFVGERADVPDLLAASDIFCQPNLGPEGFGITFIEAMAAGLPVVTSNIGGALEIVDETCGIPVPPGDRTALAAALIRLVGDRGTREQLGLSGRARARALCDPAVQLRYIAELMDGVCRETSAAANAPGTLAW